MTRSELADIVRHTIAEQMNVELDELTADTDLECHLLADSLDITEIVMSLEDEFDIYNQLDDEIERTRTVGQLIDLVASQTEVASR